MHETGYPEALLLDNDQCCDTPLGVAFMDCLLRSRVNSSGSGTTRQQDDGTLLRGGRQEAAAASRLTQEVGSMVVHVL